MHWGTGLIGLLAGVMIGWMICALCAAATRAELEAELGQLEDESRKREEWAFHQGYQRRDTADQSLLLR